jgi:hypothetical protein
MQKTALLSLLILISACGQSSSKSELRFFEKKFSQVSPLINTSSPPGNPPGTPDPLLEKTVYNDDYPLEIILYNDNTFYYNLPKLGEGRGSWAYEGGSLKLQAKHLIERLDFEFDMDYEIAPLDAEGKKLEIRFNDRFGSKVYELSKRNID